MRMESLKNSILDLYNNGSAPDRVEILRCVERYNHKEIPKTKLSFLVNQLYQKHDIESLAQKYRNRIHLSETTESILMHNIRKTHMDNKEFDLEDLNNLQFRTLTKLILEQYGYETLFLPLIKSSPVDYIVFKNQQKIAVACIQRAQGYNVTQKTIRNILMKSKQLQCERAIAFTSSEFDNDAYTSFDNSMIYLMDRKKLIQLTEALAENKMQTENSILEMEQAFGKQSSFFLEADIHSLKTKVRIEDISYYPNRENNTLVFEGNVMNCGKTPVRRLTANLYVFGRESGIIQDVHPLIGDGNLINGDRAPFKCVIEGMTDFQWLDICRYRIKLNYQNV